jgi:hypothetical protein
MQLNVSLALTILLQAAAITPTPTPEPTLAPTPTPVARGLVMPRTLQDVARERRLKTGADPKGTPQPITLGPAAAAAGGTPGATRSASPEATGDASLAGAPGAADVRVVTVSNDGIVDAAGGVRVAGTIRNAGDQTVCGVVILVRILDSRGGYLSSSQTPPDVTILPSGETTSFHTIVQAPPGIRGARTNPDRRDVTEGSTSMAGDWRLLGGAEARVVDATPCPK